LCITLSTLYHYSKALDPEQRVIFLDTRKVPGTSEQQQGDEVSNKGEVQLVSTLLHHLLHAGLRPGDVGVISPYKAQVAALLAESRRVVSTWQRSSSCRSRSDIDAENPPLLQSSASEDTVEVLTVQRYQVGTNPASSSPFLDPTQVAQQGACWLSGSASTSPSQGPSTSWSFWDVQIA
jgi:hypothetical protein